MTGHIRASAPLQKTGNVIRDSAMGLVPETVETIIMLNGDVWQKSQIGPALLEVIRLRNARTVNCVFCKAARYDVARADGLSEDKVAMIDEAYQDSLLTTREKLAIEFVDACLGFPAGISVDLRGRLNAAFSAEEILAMLVALMTFNLASRTAVSLGGMPDELPVMEVPLASSVAV